MNEIVFSDEVIFGMIITVVLVTAMVIGIVITAIKKFGMKFIPMLVGAGTWLLFAEVLKTIPCYPLLMDDNPVSQAINGNTWLYYLTAGILAGVFEETGRYIAFRTVLRNENDRKTAISYGIGHGGFEALFLMFGNFLSIAVIGLLMNSGAISVSELANGSEEAAAMITEQLKTYADNTAVDFICNIAERLIAVTIHTAFSVVVFTAVKNRKKAYLFPAAIVIHALTDFTLVIYAAGFVSMPVIELILAVIAALIALWAVRLYKDLRQDEKETV